jgi:hypothetical protein
MGLQLYYAQVGGNTMSIFEERGVERQFESRTIGQAIKSFKNSCAKCCHTGKRIKCKTCAIADVHNDIINGVVTLR